MQFTMSEFTLQAMKNVSSYCEPVPMDSEDPLFIMYASGTTGDPTGIIHTQAGYLLYAAMTHKVKFKIHVHLAFSCKVHKPLLYFMCICTACVQLQRRRGVCQCVCPGVDHRPHVRCVWSSVQCCHNCAV